MDGERKKKVIEMMKTLLSGDARVDPDFKSSIQSAVDSGNIYDSNDEFHFDATVCTTRCDGRCCTQTETVRVSPVDVDHMLKSPLLKGMSRKYIVDNFLDVFTGGQSMIPMSIIRHVDMDGLKFCPFMTIMVNKFPNKDVKLNGICMLGQSYKPAICMLYPLGRFRSFEKDTRTDEGWVYFSISCPGTETEKKVKIRDFIKNLDEKTKENNEYQFRMFAIIDTMNKALGKEIKRTMMEMFASFLFREDGNTIDKVKKIEDDLPALLERIDAMKKTGMPGS